MRTYNNPGDLCVITTLFNVGPEKLKNFELFRIPFQRGGIPLIVVECVFGESEWSLPPGPDVIQLRASDILWQKERLINCALPHLPSSFTKVAWIDADILFENLDWAADASRLLEELPVVQLAERAIRLRYGCSEVSNEDLPIATFAAVYAAEPAALLMGNFGWHGHTGFGWAARRNVLESGGLYDGCIAGGADHVMAHVFCGDWESPCLPRMLGAGSAWYVHVVDWGARIYPLVRARVGFVRGTVLHLWHGDLSSRRHGIRYNALHAANFDPRLDITVSAEGCWAWASSKPLLHAALAEYLEVRHREEERQ